MKYKSENFGNGLYNFIKKSNNQKDGKIETIK